MNQIAIAMQYNQNHIGITFQYPKLATLKAVARYKIGRLKRNARDLIERVAMAFNPMPAMALA